MYVVAICCLIAFTHPRVTTANRTSFYTQELVDLSELPMSKLIRIKSSLVDVQGNAEADDRKGKLSSRAFSLSLPVALPFRGVDKRPRRRYGEHYEEKGKDTKISKIFQLSVTALSFLAFGGYLLTLIITAIRQNAGANSGNGNVIVLSNLQGLQNYNRPKRNLPIPDSAENDFEMEKLYRGMILLSRAYAMYNYR